MDRFQKARSGLFIAEEIVKGDTAESFNNTAAADLPGRLEHELGRMLGG